MLRLSLLLLVLFYLLGVLLLRLNLFLLLLERVAMLTTLRGRLTVRIMPLDSVICVEVRAGEALFASIEDLTRILLSF